MLPISTIKYIIYFLLSFIIAYIDQRNEIFSQVWKSILLIILVLDIVRYNSFKYKRPTFLKLSYLWGIKNAVNFGLLEYPIQTISYGVKFSILPILTEYFDRKFSTKSNLFNIGLLFSQYFVLANIPFLLGLLGGSEEAVEYDGELAYTGIFTGQHPTAIVASMSLIFILYAITDKQKKIIYRLYNVLLFILDSYILYTSFTRTGWVMGIIGILIFFSFNKLNFRTILVEISICAAIFIGYNYLLENNERFYNRVNDIINDGTYEDDRGSGRLNYAAVSLLLYDESDTATRLIGTGIDPLMDNMFYKIGNRIYSHNGWIDALTGNGAIGITLMALSCIFVIAYLIKHRGNKYSDIAAACITMYYSYQFTQGGVFFYQDLLLAISLALIMNNTKAKVHTDVDMFGLKFIDVNKQKSDDVPTI